MKITIPCIKCGCQYCEAQTNAGENVSIAICRCNDGSGEFEVTITPTKKGEIEYEKHQCVKEEIESCLASRFNVDINTINHQCFN